MSIFLSLQFIDHQFKLIDCARISAKQSALSEYEPIQAPHRRAIFPGQVFLDKEPGLKASHGSFQTRKTVRACLVVCTTDQEKLTRKCVVRQFARIVKSCLLLYF